MPELPEVETIRRGLAELVLGASLREVEVLHPRAVRDHAAGAADFVARLQGRRIHAAHRRGKYLWLELEPENESTAEATVALLAHLGMSGQFLARSAADPDEKHLRVRFRLDSPQDTVDTAAGVVAQPAELRFVDQRTFGGLRVTDLVPSGIRQIPRPIAHLAPDPLETAFDLDAVLERLRARRTGIKRALLDQQLVSGIGNIYADEALWRAQLHWAQPTATLDEPAARRLFDAVAAVLRDALDGGGTSFDPLYVNVNGETGYFATSLAVYGRAGEPCPRCGTPVRRDAFMNRSAYSCPRCQPIPPDPHW